MSFPFLKGLRAPTSALLLSTLYWVFSSPKSPSFHNFCLSVSSSSSLPHPFLPREGIEEWNHHCLFSLYHSIPGANFFTREHTMSSLKSATRGQLSTENVSIVLALGEQVPLEQGRERERGLCLALSGASSPSCVLHVCCSCFWAWMCSPHQRWHCSRPWWLHGSHILLSSATLSNPPSSISAPQGLPSFIHLYALMNLLKCTQVRMHCLYGFVCIYWLFSIFGTNCEFA